MQLSARRRSRLVATALLAIVICGALALAAPAPAAGQDPPAQMSVTVIAPSGTTGPRPTGDVIFSVNGRPVLSAPLTSVTNPITTVTPLLGGAASLLGQQVTITYSGDSSYQRWHDRDVPDQRRAEDRCQAQGHRGADDHDRLARRRGAL